MTVLPDTQSLFMTTDRVLYDQLQRLDGQSYKAYKSLKGEYNFADFTVMIEHVQGDPFAAPSRVRVIVPDGGAIS